MTVYYAWKDIANLPLTQQLVERQLPFDQFEFRIQPSLNPGTALTPMKIGLASCWIFRGLLEVDRWPGHALAMLYEGRQEQFIGSINIDHAPFTSKPVPASDGANSSSGLSYSLIPIQQRWLRCFLRIMQIPIVHSPADFVTDEPELSAKPNVERYYWSCGMPGMTDRVDLLIFPAANAGSPQQLRWREMMRFLLFWIIRVARNQGRSDSADLVEDGVLITTVSFHIPRLAGSDEWDGNVTATA
ncbi:MAG: hypothetical protein Q9171_007576 [Xanthocarpia ochracea]